MTEASAELIRPILTEASAEASVSVVHYSPGYLPFGSKIIWKVLGGQQNIFQVAEDLYDDFPGAKAFGYYRPFGKPVLVIKDLELGTISI